jgi:hypothetical protein
MTEAYADQRAHDVAWMTAAERDAPDAWMPAALLADFPAGPYAVYVYYPATQREVVTRNLGPREAADRADRETAAGHRPHVSLDTCG